MFARSNAAALAIALAFTAVAASPLEVRTDSGACNSGHVQCCEKTTNAGNPAIAGLLGQLNLALPSADTVGVTCTPLQLFAAGGNSCQTTTACCTGNSFNGLVVVGCSPMVF